MNYELLTGANLAYIGDAYYELEIRKYLLSKDIVCPKEIKKRSIEFVSAKAHAYIVHNLFSEFTIDEQNIFNRGRNGAPLSHRKNLDRQDYLASSGFEAVIGYLYLKKDELSLNYIINRAIQIIEQKQ